MKISKVGSFESTVTRTLETVFSVEKSWSDRTVTLYDVATSLLDKSNAYA